MKKILKYKYDLSVSQQEEPQEQQKLPTTPPINRYYPLTTLQNNFSNTVIYPEIQDFNSGYHKANVEFGRFNEYQPTFYQELYSKNYENQTNEIEYYQEKDYCLGDDSDQLDNVHLSKTCIEFDNQKKVEDDALKSSSTKLELVYCAFCLHNFKFKTNLMKHIKSKHFDKKMNEMGTKEMEKFIITNKNFKKNRNNLNEMVFFSVHK